MKNGFTNLLGTHWQRAQRCWCLLGLILACCATTAMAADYYVATNGNDIAMGTNWNTALLTISNAMDRAGDGDRILLSAGEHSLASEITVADGITILGVWGRDETIVRRSESVNYRLFSLTHSNAVLQGIDLRNGNPGGQNGGAVWMSAGTIRECYVTGNTVTGGGSAGGIYMTGGMVVDSTVRGNYGSTSGGGIWVAGPGLVSNCVITANWVAHGGAGLRVSAADALVTHCWILHNTNTYYSGGGGVSLSAGRVVNSLIAGNRQTFPGSIYGGGGVRQTGGALINCTVAGNSVLTENTGGGVWWTGGVMTNTIVWGNRRGAAKDDITAVSQAAIAFSCAPELESGINGNVAEDPRFADFDGQDYRLLPGSPCIDTGVDTPDAPTDLNGAPRPRDGTGSGTPRTDMGAYESISFSDGPLRCGFSADPVVGMAPLTVVFESAVAGSNSSGLVYAWDLTGDGMTDRFGLGLHTVTNVYAPGRYDVRLTVSNLVGQVAWVTRAALITVQAPALYVSSGGMHQTPFTNWVTAATNLACALALAGEGTIVTVHDGIYDCVDQLLQEGIVLRSVNGREQTTLRCPPGHTGRLLDLWHPDALVEGFTLTGGRPGGRLGGAVWMSAGTIRNCDVVDNRVAGNGSAGGIYMTGGMVVDSIIRGNNGSSSAGGIWVAGPGMVSNCVITANLVSHGGAGLRVSAADALVTHCRILYNTNTYNNGGGGVSLSAGRVVNSLIAGNRQTRAGASHGGGGVRQTGGTLINCTIVNNAVVSNNFGGGVWWTGGGITNAIISDNLRGTYADDLEAVSLATISHSCAPELDHGVNGNITNAPGFIQPQNGNFRLNHGSPCIDAGENHAWMVSATDLDGQPRVRKGRVHQAIAIEHWRVDMGAWEYEPPAVGTVLLMY